MKVKIYFTQKILHERGIGMSWKITSRFMQQESFRNRGHSGIDFSMPNGTELRSIKDGYISKIVDYGSQNVGKGVLVKWNDGHTAIYGHLSKFANIKVGDRVKAGDLIGYSGNSGHVIGANGGYHLHFGLKNAEGKFVDPSAFISDIQNMNTNIVQHVPEITNVKLSFFDYMQQHMDSLTNLKLNLIHLPYDTFIIQIGQQILQFISAHSSFLNFIIGHII